APDSRSTTWSRPSTAGCGSPTSAFSRSPGAGAVTGCGDENRPHPLGRLQAVRLRAGAPAPHGAARPHVRPHRGLLTDPPARLPAPQVRVPAPAPGGAIREFHTGDYLDVLRAASAGGPVPHAYRYGLGPGDNPIWPGVYEASALACGGSILAAELVARGDVARAVNFAGGLHHAMPDRAPGFCYLNDAGLPLPALRRQGLRVAYVDIDAHHGDGVQAAFYRSADVLTISTHERGDRLFPGTGAVEEIGEGPGRGYAVNLPLNPYTDDAVYLD